MRVSKAVVAFTIGVLALTGHASHDADAAAQHATATGGPRVDGEILVKFRRGASAGAKADAHRQAGGTRLAEIARTGVQRVGVRTGDESAALARYRRNPNVLYAEPNFIRRIPEPLSHSSGSDVVPGDFHFDEQWALHNTGQLFYCIPWINGSELCFYSGTPDADIDAPEAWAISKGSFDVKVAVIDSGIDYTHPDLAANYGGGSDFIFNDGDPMDDQGHGTHVAGTIAAAMNNLTGAPEDEEGIVGVAPNVRLLAYKVCRADRTCDDFAIQQAIAQAASDGAHVINMSLGGAAYSQSLDDAVQDAWNAGVVIVAAAGNGGVTDLTYPAAFENVVSVAAFDEDHRRPSFSNFGNWVDISAPGNVIMSAYRMAACPASTVPGDTGCYTWLSGTSMATPHVAGAAALVWSRADVTGNSQVVDILLNSADGEGVDAVRLDSWTIHGGLNLHNAVSFGLTNQPPVANAGVDQSITDSDGDGLESVTFDGSASSDPDGSVASYEWREGSTVIAVGVAPTLSLSVGTHTVTLVVTDDDGESNADSVVVTVQPAVVSPDTVAVSKATYATRRSQLTVEATSSDAPDVTLTVFDTTNPTNPVEVGPLPYNSKKAKYTATFTWPSKPASVKVISSGGGAQTSAVAGN